MDYKFLKLDSKPHRLDIVIDNPPVNILTGEVMREMIDALSAVRDDKSLRVVVLKGSAKAWSAGADVSEHLPVEFESMLDVFGELCDLIRIFPAPTIAAVEGLCLGGGCEAAAMCDFVIASEKAKFGQPEIKVGVLPPVACAHFPRKFGTVNAMKIILTGDVYGAVDAKALGLVTEVVPVEDFAKSVDAFVSKLIVNSGSVMRIAKKACLVGEAKPPDDAASEVDDIYRWELMETRDAVEGLQAFLDKRSPEWKDS